MNGNFDSFVEPVTQISLFVDSETLAIFKAHAEMTRENYQTLMSAALKQFARDIKLIDMLEEETRQEDA